MANRPNTEFGWPEKQGLFDPSREKDSCGVGFVCHLKGQRSHQIIEDAIEMNNHMIHRGACGCEPDTGDGAGIFVQMPDKFLRREMAAKGVKLPGEGQYGAGIVFMSPETPERSAAKEVCEQIVNAEGQKLLGWRRVPVDSSILGKTSKSYEPVMEQIFIKRSPEITDDMAWERKLYIIRRRIHYAIRHNDVSVASKHHNAVLSDAQVAFPGAEFFFMVSLSARTMIYKGMLTPEQISPYFHDLHDADFESALAIVHSRFSTNTFPSWPRAHPNRYMSHNGEINTVMGNVNFMKARQAQCESDIFGKELKKVFPVINEDGSDSARFDNVLEFLHMTGRSLPHAVMMMIPEPWEKHESMSPEKKAFYEYHACLMEPWDGPASITFSDGTMVGAILDRNGLRPSRFYVTSDDRVIMASEVGTVHLDPKLVIKKGRLQPGRMFMVDTRQGRIIGDEELKQQIATAQPYAEWLKDNRLFLEDLPVPAEVPGVEHETVLERQRAFGYTYEDLRFILGPMATSGVQPIGSMGTDIPLAVLSNKSKLLYDYFKQIFAQVTNPALDCIREELITATETFIGSEGNLLDPQPESCRMIRMHSPLIDNKQLETLRQIDREGFKAETIEMTFKAKSGGAGLEKALEKLFARADKAVKQGVNILVLSDRTISADAAPIPALLAVGGLHHHLVKQGTRTKVSIILESGEPREVHHFAVLLGYGVDAICPYMAFETLYDMIAQNMLDMDFDKAVYNYLKGAIKGVVKTMAKMGISTVASYRGAQIFEAVGLNSSIIQKYFRGTASRIEGINIDVIAEEVSQRHVAAYPDRHIEDAEAALDPGGKYQWRRNGEYHLFNPRTIHTLQKAVRTGDFKTFQEYTALVNDQTENMATLRGLMKFKLDERTPVPIEEVEPVEAILKRFKTGAMSFGSISKEAHETLAVAMNRIGGKSNTGEGGEDPERFKPLPNGDSKRSAIKQVASGRFGVTSEYLVNSDELQIKVSQGAKPGEGGELPGSKVYPWVAKVRHSTPGVGLVSPPPHHDIYSIEDLAELIHDLKNANVGARVNVKLVAEVGVGTIAAGVAKGHADVILISGHDGGTGASPLSSIYNAGVPWELGLAETNQILLLNNLRSRVVLETDGQMKTGRDIVVGALLGAEEFGFATAPLVTMGCLMMRVCQKNTCPVGVATQNPKLREKFQGKPEHVVNFMTFIAEEIREIMAQLGFRTFNEMIGRVDLLDTREAISHWKAKGIDLTSIFHTPDVGPEVGHFCQMPQDHGLDVALDNTHLLELCQPALEKGQKVKFELPIININRVVGTITGSELTRRWGAEGLPEDTIWMHFKGSAGQSLAAFTPPGMTFELEGDTNDYLGKGLSGSKVIVYPPKGSAFKAHENIITGNVAFYGATLGTAYISGMAGERFCVRNSGVKAVIEGVGDHACEYMTGGQVICLGTTGRNFAAGMSGGVAYVLDEDGGFTNRLNHDMVNLYRLVECEDSEIAAVKAEIEKHVQYTGSERGKDILANWDKFLPLFTKVMPRDYERMLNCFKKVEEQGLSGDEAAMAAFEENLKDLSRVGGN
ncbi:MAG: glutamate synthase large subunit [Verrucomicrobiota bacterium JB024]|nr:glutamate synthase large subunit [Verrucomicrobiota bacterium JB024]